MSLIVTVDGPAASGKTSVSRELARRFGWKWVSTGTFYRGIAYSAHHLGISFSDIKALLDFIRSQLWKVELHDDNTKFFLKNRDVTADLSVENVGVLASQISQISDVRAALLESQRNCAKGLKGLVAEGRDCGTVVFPNAQIKVYLTANSDARAHRRASEQGQSFEGIKASQVERDRQDSTRKVAPLQAAPDAHIVDTSQMTLTQVVDSIEKIVRSSIPQTDLKSL